MKKELRKKVYDKYAGKCAYCGEEITLGNFQVDHIHPQHLSFLEKLDNNRFENLNPSCRKCNNFKHGFTLEAFRKELQMQVARLKKSAQFCRALRYGQVQISESPIVFYFELCK
jgi:uncharacterized protein (TIGR02646 family)